MTAIFKIMATICLSILFACLGVSKKTWLYWGRKRRDLPFTRYQQKLTGFLWSGGLMVVAIVEIFEKLHPKSVTAWADDLVRGVLLGCVVTEVAIALTDKRIKAATESPRTGRFVRGVIWAFVLIISLLFVIALWQR